MLYFSYRQAVWQSILTNVAEIQDSTDFFKSGAASMDVVRLPWEGREGAVTLSLELTERPC